MPLCRIIYRININTLQANQGGFMNHAMLEKKKKTGPKPRVTREMALQMKKLNDQGYTQASIGKMFGVADTTVSLTLRKLKDGKYNGNE